MKPKKPPKQKKKSFRFKLWLFKVAVFAAVGLAVVGYGLYKYYSYDLEDVAKIYEISKKPAITVLDKEGNILANYGDVYGRDLKYKEIPLYVKQAVLAIEDRRFFSHFGIDVLGVLRAIYVNKREGKVVQGGSTITQQLAKIAFLTPERTLKRKVQEVIIALRLEERYSKEEILRIYLNRVYLGKGNFGIDAAARYYFGKKPENLSLFESAILAGMLKAPSKYAPSVNRELAVKRARQVLVAMEEEGFITKQQLKLAKPPEVVERGLGRGAIRNPYFTDYVLEAASDFIKNTDEDIRIYTTLDIKLQQTLDDAIAGKMKTAAKDFYAKEAAGVVMSPGGEIKAMTGGVDYSKSQFNRAYLAKRQPGSAFKLFVYLAALENGYGTRSIVEDAEIQVSKWRPRNYTRDHKGEVSLEEAFANSLNTVTVRVAETIGRGKVIEMAKRLGINDKMQNLPSISLGTETTSLLTLTSAYAAIANHGYKVEPYGVLKIETKTGKILYKRQEHSSIRVLNSAVVVDMKRMLRAVISYGTGKSAMIPGADLYGKTGTTQDYRDAWFMGFSSELVVGIWAGNDNNKPMRRVTGGGLPALVWKDFMQGTNLKKSGSIWDYDEEKQEDDSSIFGALTSIFSKKQDNIDEVLEKGNAANH
jgi:penicillin-binding protein 1A